MKKHVNYEEYAKAPVSPLRFHAQWRLSTCLFSRLPSSWDTQQPDPSAVRLRKRLHTFCR